MMDSDVEETEEKKEKREMTLIYRWRSQNSLSVDTEEEQKPLP